MSSYKDYETASTSYDNLRFAVGSDVMAGMIQLYCGKPLKEIYLLDAGCGTGNYTKELLDAGLGHVSMLDASRGMLEKAREKLSEEISSGRVLDLTQSKMPPLPYPDGTFDAVVFSLVLHHLQTDAEVDDFPVIVEAISEASRVLKKDGVLTIATLFPETFLSQAWYTSLNQSINKKFIKRFPSFDQFMKMFENSGLRLLSKLDHYKPTSLEIQKAVSDPLGPTKTEWRDVYSYWACASNEEINDVVNKIEKMQKGGTLDKAMSDFENYDETSQNYDTLRHAIGSDVIAGMLPFYCNKPLCDLHVLDAGCGTGNYTKALLDAGLGHVSILDASRGMLEKAREKLNAEILAGRVKDITETKMPPLPYPDDNFDVVFFNLVLHHIQTDPDGVNFPAVEETIFEAKRVLKKDGVIAIGTCFPDTYISLIWYTKLSDAISDRFRKRFPSFDQLSSIFDRNGLKLLSKLDVYEPPIPKIVAAMTDPLGPTKKAWRDINSYWALGTPEEIADIENKVLKMHDEGTLELFVKENTKMDYLYRPTLLFLTPL